MQFALSSVTSRLVLAAIAFGLASQIASAAESVYIQQASGGAGTPKALLIAPLASAQTGSGGHVGREMTPEMNTPVHTSNTAGSLTVGNYNTVAQIQAGHNDTSGVSIIGGQHDKVNVLQAGNNDVSHIALIGFQGVNLNIIQGANAAPINMVIVRLPNGSVWIRR